MTQFDKYIGMLIDDRYEIKEVLGVGGMAVVFLAYDVQEECEIAIKMLKEEVASDETALECFESESRAISMLSHPNIRQIYDISMSGEHKYLTMEYLDGPTLKSYVKSKDSISQDEALHFIIQILDALDHTHSKGIVHRDIKPQNIIVTSDNTVKITDFGIAKLYDPHMTGNDEKGVGTVYYISPEQASGKNIDARGDIYSVGIMLYELVCNKLPFVADDPGEVAYMQVTKEPEKPSDIAEIPVGLEQIILRAIAKNPDDRFSDAGQMLAAVKRFKETPEAVFDFVSVPADSRFFDSASKGSKRKEASDVIVATPEESETPVAPASPKKFFSDLWKKLTGPKEKPEVQIETVKKKSPVSFASIICGALLACLIVAVMTVSYVYDNFISESLSSSDAQIIEVLDFTNRQYNEQLVSDMEKLGYSITIVRQQNSDYLANTIIKQSIDAGAKRPIIPGVKFCEITLYVSSGEEMVTLANYVGKNHRDAEIEMRRIGFSCDIIHQTSSVVPEGAIIKMFPEAGSYITSDTRITLYVSSGQNLTYSTMPDLRGKSASEIRAIFANKLNLTEVTYEYSDTVPAGQVISQYPYSGTKVPDYITDVSIVVSMGSRPSPTPPAPEPETPGTGTEIPGDDTETPGAGNETPGDDTETPGAGNETP